MIVGSRPIVVVVVALLESELVIDPGAIKVDDKVINIIQFWHPVELLAILLK